MSTAPTPVGFDDAYTVAASHSECLLTVGFDRDGGGIPRFLVRLHYAVSYSPLRWEPIARFDHNEAPDQGHDVYAEGLHVDVHAPPSGWVKLHPRHPPLPSNRGAIVQACFDYLDRHAQYFVDVYTGATSPTNPPGWPDGGRRGGDGAVAADESASESAPPDTLLSMGALPGGMSDAGEVADDEPLSPEELTEVLAEATGTDPETLDREAEAVEIAPPEDADVVEE